jgi:SAM-dependent methyltransferase
MKKNYKTYKDSHTGQDYGKTYDAYLENKFESFIYDLEQITLKKIFKKHYPKGIKSSLDFACGTGRLTKVIEPYTKENHGLDISKDMIAVAKKKAKKTTFIVGDITTKKNLLKGKQYDLVTAFRFFLNAEHSLRVKALKGITPHIGNKFICNIHMHRSSIIGFQFYLRKILFNEKKIQKTITMSYMRKILKRNGLHIIETYPLAHIPSTLNHLPLPKKILKNIELFLTKTKILHFLAKDIIIVAEKRRK